jgi:hypothetical protein
LRAISHIVGLTEGVIVVGHHVGEGVGDVTTDDNLSCFPGFVGKLEKIHLGQGRRKNVWEHTRRKENIMHPTNSHFPVSKGMATQSVSFSFNSAHWLKIWLDQESVDNMVMAVKISET